MSLFIKLFLVLALMDSTLVLAEEYDSPYTEHFMGPLGYKVCVRAALVGLEVTGAMDGGVYQVGARMNGVLVMHGLLQTVKAKFTVPGLIRSDLVVAYMGVKELPLDNGFTGKFGIWKECIAK